MSGQSYSQTMHAGFLEISTLGEGSQKYEDVKSTWCYDLKVKGSFSVQYKLSSIDSICGILPVNTENKFKIRSVWKSKQNLCV